MKTSLAEHFSTPAEVLAIWDVSNLNPVRLTF
jgi:hypothetical protein